MISLLLIYVAAIVFSAVSSVYIIATDEHVHQEDPQMMYLHREKKGFPWRCPTCALFDFACFAECDKKRKEKALAAAAEGH
jgi:hypothetical protein